MTGLYPPGRQSPQRRGNREHSGEAPGSVCDFAAWPRVPVRAVAGADDRFFPVDFQWALAAGRLGADADVLPGGHLIALARPAELAGYLAAI
jgi:hypothetical protein